ncbi:triose-phosphate isomerase [Caulobacter sp.]|uniref:triose-phosphate isomerase n=1 Tax=Caulobacter sp. TaxID=78 RepID=UPI001B160177|nr:triose-phosphate isomerase [Caulobacter sp.]
MPWARGFVLGHSERRSGHGETDDLIAAKVRRLTQERQLPSHYPQRRGGGGPSRGVKGAVG